MQFYFRLYCDNLGFYGSRCNLSAVVRIDVADAGSKLEDSDLYFCHQADYSLATNDMMVLGPGVRKG